MPSKNIPRRILLTLAAAALTAAAGAQTAPRRVISARVTLNASAGGPALYAPTPGSVASAVFSASADGTPVPVEKFGDASYARFITTGGAAMTITTPGHAITAASVSPLRENLQLNKNGQTLSFNIKHAGSYFVRVDDLEPLMIFADAPEAGEPPRPGDPRVVDLSTYLPPDRDPAAPVTALIQQAIDNTAALADGQGGILFIPDGRYVAGQLKLKSNVFLYLSSGALLQSQTDFNPVDFPPQAQAGAQPDSSFIYIGDARNVRIGGRGIIDGNGHAVRTLNPGANIKLLRTAGAADVLIEDVFFRDSARWSLHVLDSDRVALRNFKLVNDLRGSFDPQEGVHVAVVTNTDGVDIDASADVLVEGSFIYTGDDAITPKVTNYMNRQRPCHGIVARGNTLWTLKCALRVGDEAFLDIHDVLFENNDIIRADRAIALRNGDGAHMRDIRVLNNRVEYIGGDYNERFFTFRIWLLRPPESKPGLIDNVLIKDFYARQKAPQDSDMEGLDAAHRITGVTFDNIVIGGTRATGAADIPLAVRNFADTPIFSAPAATP
jgi:hypothetical protein